MMIVEEFNRMKMTQVIRNHMHERVTILLSFAPRANTRLHLVTA